MMTFVVHLLPYVNRTLQTSNHDAIVNNEIRLFLNLNLDIIKSS
jgi:hypothetical protein